MELSGIGMCHAYENRTICNPLLRYSLISNRATFNDVSHAQAKNCPARAPRVGNFVRLSMTHARQTDVTLLNECYTGYTQGFEANKTQQWSASSAQKLLGAKSFATPQAESQFQTLSLDNCIQHTPWFNPPDQLRMQLINSQNTDQCNTRNYQWPWGQYSGAPPHVWKGESGSKFP